MCLASARPVVDGLLLVSLAGGASNKDIASRLHITDLERKRRDLDAHISEFKEVETQVTAELKQRGVDPEGDD